MDATLGLRPDVDASEEVVSDPNRLDRAVLVLAAAELRHLLRHPVLLGFVALTAGQILVFNLEMPTDTFVWYQVLTGMPFLFLGGGALVTGVLLASRSRHDGTAESDGSVPVGPSGQTLAQILAFAGLAAAGLVTVVVGWLLLRGWQGLPVALDTTPGPLWIDYAVGREFPPTDVVPSVPELLLGPASLLATGVLGMAIGRAIPTRWVTVPLVPVILAYWIFVSWDLHDVARWFLPLVEVGQDVGWVTAVDQGSGYSVVQGFDVAAAWWHLAYLTGATTAMGALLIGSVRTDRRVQFAVVAGLGVAAVAGILQVTSAVGTLA